MDFDLIYCGLNTGCQSVKVSNSFSITKHLGSWDRFLILTLSVIQQILYVNVK